MKKKGKPRLLILYASAGAGHKQAAFALKKVCDETQSAVAEAVDILDYTPAYFKKFYTGSYLEIVKRIPELWGYLYGRLYKHQGPSLSSRLHHVIGNLHIAPLLNYVKDFKPDAVVFTHFLGSGAVEKLRLRKLLNVPFYCVITDYAIHSFWINKDINKYYVCTEGEKRILKRHGLKANQIEHTGIPVSPEFSKKYNKAVLRRKLKLDAKLPTVLMISGRFNLKGYEQLLASFKDVKQKMQLVVLAGNNRLLTQKLTSIAKGLKNMRFKIYGMVDNMHELMAASDIVISKPGGLTTSEVLASNALMAVIDPIPGQEQRNSDYLLESGVAIRIHDMENGGLKIADLLTNQRRLSIMRKHLKWVSRPKAAYNIVQDIVSELK
ncbi:MAG: glycosyltransferase [Candidatus Omnitrophota bacterium]